jgi:hypothetical protein
VRFPMRLNRWLLPVFAPFGGTPRQSFVDVTEDAVRFRFGWSFDTTVPRADIDGAARISWPVIAGLGWRLWGDRIGLIGSLSGVVEVRLRTPHRVRLVGIPWRCRRIAVSLQDPDAFLTALGAGG